MTVSTSLLHSKSGAGVFRKIIGRPVGWVSPSGDREARTNYPPLPVSVGQVVNFSQEAEVGLLGTNGNLNFFYITHTSQPGRCALRLNIHFQLLVDLVLYLREGRRHNVNSSSEF
jgi:hypothetical protein